MSLDRDAALVVIDVQKGLDEPMWGRRNNPEAEANIARLLESWRAAGSAVYHVRHHSRNPHSALREGAPGAEIKDEVRPLPGEPVVIEERQQLVHRHRPGGAAPEPGHKHPRDHGSDHQPLCRKLLPGWRVNLGFETYLVSDTTATFDREGPDGRLHRAEEIQAMTLANLHGEFAEIVTTQDVLERLAGAEVAR